MKVVYQFRHFLNKKDFDEIMNIVKDVGEISTDTELSDDYIYIEYQGRVLKFNRYNEYFISKVEESQKLNPDKDYSIDGCFGHLHIEHIDDRFSNKKYYKIKKIKHDQEVIEILKDVIIEDLYNNCLVKK